jgi:amino acid permease
VFFLLLNGKIQVFFLFVCLSVCLLVGDARDSTPKVRFSLWLQRGRRRTTAQQETKQNKKCSVGVIFRLFVHCFFFLGEFVFLCCREGTTGKATEKNQKKACQRLVFFVCLDI